MVLLVNAKGAGRVLHSGGRPGGGRVMRIRQVLREIRIEMNTVVLKRLYTKTYVYGYIY